MLPKSIVTYQRFVHCRDGVRPTARLQNKPVPAPLFFSAWCWTRSDALRRSERCAAIMTPCRWRYSRLRFRAVRADVLRRCGRCPQLHAELSRPRMGLPASITGGSENLDRWGARAPGASRLRCPWSAGSTLSPTFNTWLIRFHPRAGLIAGAARFVGSIRFA